MRISPILKRAGGVALMGAALLMSAHSFAGAASRDKGFTTYDIKKIHELNGFWRSRGYGWIWHVDDNSAETYHVTKSFCTASWDWEDLEDSLGDKLQLSKDGKTMRVSWGDPGYFYEFQKLESLPDKCRNPSKKDPFTVYDALAETFSEHYAFFEARKVNWQAMVAKHRRRVTAKTTDRELFKILSDLLSTIDDAHVGLKGEIDDDEKYFSPPRNKRPIPALAQQRAKNVGFWTRRIGHRLVTGRLYSAGEGRIRFGSIGRDIAYLYVSSTGWALRETMEESMGQIRRVLRGKKALLIDISRNFGGTDYTARRFASYFTNKRMVGYYKYARGTPRKEAQAVYVQPGKKLLFTGPIFLMTGKSTISAAEILAMCLRNLPNVTHIGAATRGSLSDVLFKRLPNGWSPRLSNEIYMDSKGKAWEGIGIKPQIEFIVYRESQAPYNRLQAARGIIKFIRQKIR